MTDETQSSLPIEEEGPASFETLSQKDAIDRMRKAMLFMFERLRYAETCIEAMKEHKHADGEVVYRVPNFRSLGRLFYHEELLQSKDDVVRP